MLRRQGQKEVKVAMDLAAQVTGDLHGCSLGGMVETGLLAVY